MKNYFPYLLTTLFGVLGLLLFSMNNQTVKIKKVPKKDRMDLAWQHEFEMTKDPQTGEVPRERLLDAWRYMKSIQQQRSKAAIPGINWTERGPDNFGGRTRTMLVDLNDSTHNTIWTAGVAGGLWKTTDISATSPVWTVIDDFFQNLAITSIAQSTVNTQHMYFTTGEGYFNSDAVRGLGIWKSTDGGASWAQLAATNNSDFYYCQKIVVINVDTLLVATRNGIFRSVDGGNSFLRVLAAGISGALNDNAYDIEVAVNGTIYASMQETIHKSYNAGATWTTPLTLPVTGSRIELALAASDSNYVYAVLEQSSAINGIIRSSNAGISFTSVSEPVDADGGIPSSDFARNQAWYDISVAVDPLNPLTLFVGGIDLFKSNNGGASWQQISHWYGGFSFQYVHADQHFVLYSPGSSSIAYFCNDGGIFRTTNATSVIPVITGKNDNYRTLQFYACDLHPDYGSDYFLAGSQDNGSHQFTAAGMGSTSEVTGGDGAFCHIDQGEPQYQFTSYVYNNYYRSDDGGGSFFDVISNNNGRFINPTDYDDSTNTLYAAEDPGVYLRWPDAHIFNSTSTVSISAFNSATVSAVKVSPNTLNRVFFGTGSGRIVRVNNAHASATGTHINVGAGMPASYMSSIEVEKGNDDHILVTYSSFGVNSIWETTNGGTSWTSVEGNLPDIPVRWVLLSPNNPSQALIATDLGVWSTDLLNGTSTDWQPSSSGLANVRCDMLKVRASDKMVIVATHGRGLFSSDVFATPQANFTMSHHQFAYPDKTIAFTNTSTLATSYLWDFGDGTTSTIANPVKMYTSGGTFTVTLQINGGVSSINKTIFILPFRGVPYTTAAGGDFETNIGDFLSVYESGTFFEIGNSAISGKSGVLSGTNAWVTGLAVSSYDDNTTAYLYTPSFNCTASGTYTFSFNAKNIFEIGYDGYRVEYSLNGGDTWTPLSTTASPGWYDYANPNNDRPFPQFEAFFNAANATYSLKSFSTTSLQGNSKVCFRFVFKSDFSVNDAGLAIDNFQFSGPSNNPLPVSLLSFTGRRKDEHTIAINWVTSSEVNIAGFELQRKFNWNEDFVPVTFVKGKGSRSQKAVYEYADENNSKGNSYYRLKIVDKDGSVEYSKNIIVGPDHQGSAKFVKSIVPAMQSQKQFFIYTLNTQAVQVSVVTNSGQQVKNTTLSNGQLLDLSDLSAGIYYCRFTSVSGEQQIEKVLVY